MGETERLALREAAEIIGIPLDALRKRVYRGSIPAEKVDGQYTVLRSDAQRLAPAPSDTGETLDETVLGHGSDTGETPPSLNGITGDYIESLKGEILFLRNQVETLLHQVAAERERSDVIQLHRIEALTAGDTAEQPETVTEPHVASPAGPGREEPVSMSQDTLQARSMVTDWFHRLFGRS